MAVIKKNEIIIPFLGSKLSFIRGLDPLGLLNIGDRTFYMLLPGMNSVTNRIRYYSFYCWLFDDYSKNDGSTNPKDQQKTIRRAEYLLAIIAAKNKQSGVPGILKARNKFSIEKTFINIAEGADETNNSFDYTYWKNPRGVFGQNYVSSMSQLKLIREMENGSDVYIRTAFDIDGLVSGKQLAQAFDENIKPNAKTIFLRTLQQGTISQEEINQICDDFNMKQVPIGSNENVLLTQLIVGADNPVDVDETYYRKNTSLLYLEEIYKNKSFVSVEDFVITAYNNKGLINGNDDETYYAYYYYQLNQYWHMSATGLLSALLTALREKSDGAWYVEAELIEEISNEITNILVSENQIETNGKFKSLKIIDEDNFILANTIKKGEYIIRFLNGFLLLRKIMFENGDQISDLKSYTKLHDLESPSNFISVYHDLIEKSDYPMKKFIEFFMKKYVIHRHQFVSLKKMNDTQSSEKFVREDGLIRFIDEINYDFSAPRLSSLISFFKDLGIIKNDGNKLSHLGLTLKQKLSSE